MTNEDYLSEHGNPTSNPLPLDDPSIQSCTLSSTTIIDPDTNDFIREPNGEPLIHRFQVMVKNGLTSTYDNQYQNHSSIHKDSDSDTSDSDDSITSDIDDDCDHLESSPRIERAYLYKCNEDTKILPTQFSGGVYRAKVLERVGHDTNWRLTGQECAIKTLRWDRIIEGRQNGKMEDPRTEIAVMILLRDCYDSYRSGRQDGGGGINNVSAAEIREAVRETNVILPLDFLYDNNNLYIIMPYCDGGELFTHRENFTEEICRAEIFPQMLNGLEWLQRARICHRDMSLENFVIDSEGEAKRLIIIDFGLAVRIPYSEDGTRQLISPQQRCGKGSYMSPEIYQTEPFDGHAVDLWAAGIVLFILLIGGHPWEGKLPNIYNQRYVKMSGGNLAKRCRRINVSKLSLDLLQTMLRSNVHERLSLTQILAHRWLNEVM